MDFTIIIILIAFIAILLTFFIVVSSSKNKEKKNIPNYKALFILGISWLPIGIVTDNVSLWGMGIVFFIVGIANKDKWGQETKWADLPQKTKRVKIAVIITLSVFLLLAIAYILLKE